ncbi:glycosyltransferase family 2 protein [Pediococcus pentosaceus]|uniref:glycosyltransferase family 2 protein n=1 Tax=Pediococcus pentosaceus TaxID=1255 RepID=UPI00223B00A9|nr:glycosyltransferase family 2 protein [Pediococcus pentosaceus]MCS8563944.1 glycosyltransferase family 2 protein [Pediococcus pentosaceus]MCS8568239.1 glycosyltransferase family 2 protein [Pediococcus pentosaceus]MCS8580881.1 glycosyltransferase family 2 protein [Pediococcus pentosaceus]
MKEEKLAVIILNYNNYEQTLTCVKNIKESTKLNVEIIVVDNNSSDDSYATLMNEEKELGYSLLQSGFNGGFAYGNNVGIDYAISKGARYICVMNNDIQFETNVLQEMLDFYTAHPRCGIIGPAVLDDKKIISFSGAKIDFYAGKSRRFNQGENYQVISQEKEIKTDYVLGAFMFFSTDVFMKVGKIPEGYFLDFEETEWGWRVQKNGYQNYCVPQSFVIHAEGSTINSIEDLGFYFMHRNRVLFERRNANFTQKIVFYPYVILALFKECLKRRSLRPFIFSFDGITQRNRFEYLKK